MKKVLVLFLTVAMIVSCIPLTLSASADATVIYVASTGNDATGNGTAAAPFQTVEAALASKTSGDLEIRITDSANLSVDASYSRADSSVVTITSSDASNPATLSVGKGFGGGNTQRAFQFNSKVIFKNINVSGGGQYPDSPEDGQYTTVLCINAGAEFINSTVTVPVGVHNTAADAAIMLDASTLAILRFGDQVWSPDYVTVEITANQAVVLKNNSQISSLALACASWDADRSSVQLSGDLTIFAENSTVSAIRNTNEGSKTAEITGNLNIITVGTSTVADHTLTSVGAVKKYNVTVTGGTADVVLNANTFAGFDFKGANEDYAPKVAGQFISKNSSGAYVIPEGTVSVTFGILTNPATISFSAGEGSGTMSPVLTNDGSYIVLPACTFTNTGKTFVAWTDGTDYYTPGMSYKVNGDKTISALWGSAVYVSSAGNDGNDGSSSAPKATLDAAIRTLTGMGVVYVSGTVAGIETTNTARSLVRISGLSDSAVSNVVTYANANIYGDTIFSNITLKTTGTGLSDSIRINGNSVTFGNGTVSSGTQFNISANGGKVRYASEKVSVNSNGAYLAFGGDATTVVEDTVVNLDSGNLNLINALGGNTQSGINWGYIIQHGDITYNINGGSAGEIYLGSTAASTSTAGKLYGNLVLNISGGNFANKRIYYGYQASTNRDDYNVVGNTVAVINTKQVLENFGSLSGLTIQDAAYLTANRQENILVINNAETEHGISINNKATLDRIIRVLGGRAVPVFEDTPNDSANTQCGALLGFELISDKDGKDAYIGTTKLEKNENGYYTLPKGTVNVTFAKNYYTASFEGINNESGSTPAAYADSENGYLLLPECGFTKQNHTFVGWQSLLDSNIFVPGQVTTISADTIFIPVWKKNGTANVIYISAAGADSNNGLSAASPKKTISSVLSLYPTQDLEIVLLTDITVMEGATYECVPARNDGSKVTFRADGTQKKITLGGSGSGNTRNWNMYCETVFENISFKTAKADGKYRNLVALNGNNATFKNCDVTGISVAAGMGWVDNGSVVVTADPVIKLDNTRFSTLFLGPSGWTDSSETNDAITGHITVHATNGSVLSNISVASTGYDANESNVRIVGDLTLVSGKNSTIGAVSAPEGKTNSITGNINYVCANGGSFTGTNSVTVSATNNYNIIAKESVVTPATSGGRFAGFNVKCNSGEIAQIAYDDIAKLYKGGVHAIPTDKTVTIYTIAGENISETLRFHLNGGMAIDSIAHISDEGILTFPSSPDKSTGYFAGWYIDSTLQTPYISGTELTGELDLYAKWNSIVKAPENDTTPNSFYIRGIQVRQADSNVGQGLRYITRIDTENIFASLSQLNSKNSNMLPKPGKDVGYGSVVMTTEYLGEDELRLGGVYEYNNKTYNAQDVPAYNTFATSTTALEYTVCLVNMELDEYDVDFTARPYITYYTASDSLARVYGEPYSISLYDAAKYIYSYGDESAAAYDYLNNNIISHFVNGVALTSKPVKDQIENSYTTLKNSILNSANITPSGTVYYVSAQGNDSNNGKSTSAPWKTLAKVQAALNDGTIAAGSTILFRRGDVFRGTLVLTQNNLTLSAYGTGKKPMINGSPKNLAEVTWTKTDYKNVWVADGTYNNIGNMVFNASLTQYAELEELHGWMLPYSYGAYQKENTLASDLQFYSNLDTADANYGKLYLYSEQNPAERFDSIEISPHGKLINVNNRSGITISNLEFRYGGSHAVATGDAYSLTVENCVFAYIGGSVHGGHGTETLFGNAVEAYGATDGFNVRNNWIYQVYDAGITQQNNVASRVMNNANWTNNIIEYTHWPFEIWNYYDSGNKVTNLTIEGNIVRNTGAGFGSFTRRGLATVCHMYGFPDTTVDCYVRNNIFDRTTGRFAGLSTEGSKKVIYSGNTYIAENGKDTLSDNNGEYDFTYDTKAETLKTILGDTTAKIYFYN